MFYLSTRGEGHNKTFTEILLEGLAPNGGLYVPAHYPSISLEVLRGRPYHEVAALIFRRFAPEITLGEWATMTKEVYTAERFGRFAIAPVKWLEPNLGILELSNGPTLSFKDIALQMLAAVMDRTLHARGESLNILGATSGDTGSAAEYAIAGKARMRCFMLSPWGRMSPFQQRQMYTLDHPNIHNLAVEGTFDDCQALVKAVNADAAFKRRYKLGAVNSINWARIVAQMVYWVYAYLQAPRGVGGRVMFAVPSGNFGNALSAYYTNKMLGVPADIIVATNENYVLHEFFGLSFCQYRVRKGSEVKVTSSPSMDIAEASNFERYLFDIIPDPAEIRRLYRQLKETGAFTLGPEAQRRVAASGIVSGMATEHEVLETIRLIDKYGIVIDPHTAVAMKVGLQYRKLGVPLIVAETAKAAKFEDTIQRALGRILPVPNGYQYLERLPLKVEVIKPDVEVVKHYIASHSN